MKQNEVLLFLGSACVVVLAWIAFTVVHNSLTSTISQTTTQAIIPIQPTFDTQTIAAMKKRLSVTPLYTISGPSQNSIVVTTAPGGAIASQSAQVASPGGAFR